MDDFVGVSVPVPKGEVRHVAVQPEPTAFGREVISAIQRVELLAQSDVLPLDNARVAAGLQDRGYKVAIRQTGSPALGQKSGTAVLKTLSNSFLVITNDSGEELVVDIHFASHFELPSATAGYKAMVASLPEVFAGSREQLTKLVKDLAGHLAVEYTLQGMPIPPWRGSTALLSLWQPASWGEQGTEQGPIRTYPKPSPAPSATSVYGFSVSPSFTTTESSQSLSVYSASSGVSRNCSLSSHRSVSSDGDAMTSVPEVESVSERIPHVPAFEESYLDQIAKVQKEAVAVPDVLDDKLKVGSTDMAVGQLSGGGKGDAGRGVAVIGPDPDVLPGNGNGKDVACAGEPPLLSADGETVLRGQEAAEETPSAPQAGLFASFVKYSASTWHFLGKYGAVVLPSEGSCASIGVIPAAADEKAFRGASMAKDCLGQTASLSGRCRSASLHSSVVPQPHKLVCIRPRHSLRGPLFLL